jgi:tetratricopeptide (TPR) repeat protein
MKTLLLLLFITATAYAQDVSSLIRQGDAFDLKYQTEEALKYYLPAGKLLPTNAELLLKIARQYIYRMPKLSSSEEKLASAKTALAYTERAVKAEPERCEAHLGIALCWGRIIQLQGNKEKVEGSRIIKEAAEKAVKLDPNHDYAWHMLGRWHQGLAGANSIVIALARLIYGDIPEASNEEAEKYFLKAIELKPDRLIHQIELGRTYAQMGKKKEARLWLEKGLAMPDTDIDDPETKDRGRRTLEKLGD